MNIPRRNIFGFVACFLVGYVLLLVILSFYLVFYLEFIQTNSFSDRPDELKLYQFLEIEHDNVISVGTVSLRLDLDEEDFIFSSDGGSYTLVSNFGSKEFKCKGICVCRGSGQRRMIIAKRGITYLLATFSPFLAVSMAREYFKEECLRRMSEDCDSDIIDIEIEDCEALFQATTIGNDGKLKDIEVNEVGEYWCSGSCVVRDPIFSGAEIIDKYKSRDFWEYAKSRCEGIQQEGELSTKIDKKDPRLKFQKEILEPTCVEICKLDIINHISNLFQGNMKNDFEKTLEMNEPDIWCTCGGGYGDEINPSISCQRMS